MGVAALGAGTLAWSVRHPRATLLAPSVWQGPRDRKALALTFDDGPSESTGKVLDLLAAHGVKATFFLIGANAERLPEAARRIAAEGHEIGNHTYSHSPLYLRHRQFIADDIEAAQRVLEDLAGAPPKLFRAPYGARWFGLREAQQRLGLTGVTWSTLGLDWKLPAPAVERRLRRGTRPGAIFCLHDGRDREIAPDIGSTLEAVRAWLPRLREQGYHLVTVSNLLWPKVPSNA